MEIPQTREQTMLLAHQLLEKLQFIESCIDEAIDYCKKVK
jgi:hypothetical protein